MARLRGVFDPLGFLGGMTIAGLGAFVIRYFSALPLWVSFCVALFALLANGLLATWEDEQPGGFNDVTERPRDSLRRVLVVPGEWHERTPIDIVLASIFREGALHRRESG